MDDFYVYYKLLPNDMTQGIIKAISPSKLKGFEGVEFIRVPPDEGKAFTIGIESLNKWTVSWSNAQERMALIKTEVGKSLTSQSTVLIQIPTKQDKPQVTVTYTASNNEFNIRTRGVSISYPNISMVFFVTRLGDPNIPYHHLRVNLYDSMKRGGHKIPCDVQLPKKFSVFTKPEMSRYKLRIE